MIDPDRYLVGSAPCSVVITARTARFLDRAALNQIRRDNRGGLDQEITAQLAAIHLAGLQYAETAAANGRTPLPQVRVLSRSRHDLLDTTAVAARFGCKPRNVRDLHQRGRLDGNRVGGRLLFTPEVVDGYLADRNR